ncbi:hypothetical protein [Arsenophonus nasoniae]|uniref:ECs1072 family phage-associated protein n=1 Tax=Arsenophonus nasoniae TaxID=638 RepID=UPI00387A312D
MSVYAKLFTDIQKAVFPAYNSEFAENSLVKKEGNHDSAKIHSYLFLLLEIIIYEYRKKHATIFEPLKGDKALKHLFFTRYPSLLQVLNSLPLESLVFALLKDLSPENLPQQARNYVNEIKLNKDSSGIDWSLKVNWNLGSGEQTLKMGEDLQEI